MTGQLLEEYDLFYIDGGYRSGSLQMSHLYDTIYDAATRSLSPHGHGFTNRNFCGVSFAGGSITSYTLATDQTGNSFASQVNGVHSLGVLGIQHLSEIYGSQKQELANQEDNISQLPDQDPLTTYEQQLESGGSTGRGDENIDSSIEDNGESNQEGSVEVPDKNPN